MGGFVGFCKDGMSGEEKLITVGAMLKRIACRGNGKNGAYTDENVTLGFIGDDINSTQPTVSACGRYVICFDGKVVNADELIRDVKVKGTSTQPQSDAEAVLYGCIAYGDRVLERLRGHFSFVFYDRLDGTVILARDPFGIKPLYYSVFEGCFMFASEIKAFTAHPKFKKAFNSDILPYYLQFQYVPTEQTAFSGVSRLKAGCILTYKNGGIKKERYFYPPIFGRYGYTPFAFFSERDGKPRKRLPYERNVGRAAENIRRAVKESVDLYVGEKERPGAFLSGGVDSGYITALSGIKSAFTVGFASYGFDERAYAAEAAERFGVSLETIEADADDFFHSVSEVLYRSDEPYANLSAIPLYLLCKKASEKVDTVLSGEGADELFGGYEWYFDSVLGKTYRMLPLPLRARMSKVRISGRSGDFLRRNKGDAKRAYVGQARIMDENDACLLLNKPYRVKKDPYELTHKYYTEVNGASLLRSKMYLDLHFWLPGDILLKADRMTSAFSLKLIAPYLDLEVLKAAQGLADKLLVRGKTGKYAFRVAASELVGNEAAFRKKKGFPVPIREWLREKKYADIFKKTFTGAIGRQFFDTERLISMLASHVAGVENHARILYTVFAFIKWYELFFEEKRSSLSRDKLMYDTLKEYHGKKEERENEELYSGNSRL